MRLSQANLHRHGTDPEADKEAVRESAESHMARIKAMLGSG
ncbi:hypothetical protein [Rhodanobacter sp. L36]|nr:hypothetical protein [Rhodanobacter sp. L36]